MITPQPHITVKDLTMAYGSFVVQQDLTFTVNRGDVFIIMGGSGCGKSTLMRHMVGLKSPAKGQVFYDDVSFWETGPEQRDQIMRNIGILYQSGALWSSMTLAENIGLPLFEYKLHRSSLPWSGWPVLKITILRKSAAGCANAPVWPGRWRWIRISFFSTNRQPDWIPSAPGCWMI